jgi:hypothetical protein
LTAPACACGSEAVAGATKDEHLGESAGIRGPRAIVLKAGNADSFEKTIGRDCRTHAQTQDVSPHSEPAAVSLTKLACVCAKYETWPNLSGGVGS